MKNARLFLSAFVVFAFVGSMLAFNSNRGQGALFCTDNGTICASRVDFIEQSPDDGSAPCGKTAGVLNPVYKAITNDCVLASPPFQAAAQ